LDLAGIAYDDSLVIDSDSSDVDDADKTLKALLDRDDPPTAVLFFTDPMAIQVLSLAKQRGIRIPQDLSIAGFDGILSSGVTEPALTTVRQPMLRMGALAAESLIELIENGSEQPIQRTLPVRLITRASTGRAPTNLEKVADA
jgi:LacI family transcriptional regulator